MIVFHAFDESRFTSIVSDHLPCASMRSISAHAQARQAFGRLIERLAVLVAARYLGEHAYLHKLVEQVVHDADRYARVELQLQRRVGLAALAEAVADAARYDEAKQRLVAVAEVFGLSLESVVVHVLIGVAQLRTEQAYQPRYLHPEHEQRQSGKRTVDGVVAAHPNLRVDVEELQTLHGYTGEYAGAQWRNPPSPLCWA